MTHVRAATLKTPQHAASPSSASSIIITIIARLMLAYMSFVFVCELVPGENASCAAGQPPRRAAQAEPGRAGSGPGRGGRQAGERGTRGSAGVLQGEHEPVEKHGETPCTRLSAL